MEPFHRSHTVTLEGSDSFEVSAAVVLRGETSDSFSNARISIVPEDHFVLKVGHPTVSHNEGYAEGRVPITVTSTSRMILQPGEERSCQVCVSWNGDSFCSNIRLRRTPEIVATPRELMINTLRQSQWSAEVVLSAARPFRIVSARTGNAVIRCVVAGERASRSHVARLTVSKNDFEKLGERNTIMFLTDSEVQPEVMVKLWTLR